MSLNTRSAMDPRFAFHGRPVVGGFMLATGVLSRPVPQTPGVPHWNPNATDPADRTPAAPTALTPLYQGPARVQPQLGWRGRRLNWRDETVTDQLVRIQLDFARNKINGGVLPDVHADDIFKVTDVLSVHGKTVDPGIQALTFVVMNWTPTSNAWVRTLFCDAVMP